MNRLNSLYLILLLVLIDKILCNFHSNTPKVDKGAQTQGVHLYKSLENKSEEDESDPIDFKTTKIVIGLEYLGSGYDIVKANTMGDSDQGEDLGYRAPVIDFTWAQTDVGVTNSLDSLQPVGGWVRPKISCGESENVTEIDSISKLKDVTESDVGINVSVPNVGTGSLNAQYEILKDNTENTNNKLYSNTYYCFTYAAGIPPTLDWTTTEEFTKSVSELPKIIKKYERCTVDKYKQRRRVCADLIKWMEFFSEFGTHVVTQIHLGGKLTRYLSVPSSAVESLSKKGYDVNTVIGSVISGVSGEVSFGLSQEDENEIQNMKRSSKLKFSVLGGIHPDKSISAASIRKWKSTVPKYPMPIKIDLTNISKFLPRGYYNSFKEALNFYIGLSKALPWDIEEKEGRIMTLKSLLVNSRQVLATSGNGDAPIAKCPNGTRILFGFILNIDKQLNSHVYPCVQNKTFCTVDHVNDDSNVIIYTLCGNSLGVEFKTKYGSEQEELTCDDSDEIVTGFNILLKDSKLTPCVTGESVCKTDHRGSMIIICADKRLPELKAVTTVTGIINNDKVNMEGHNYTLIGFVGCINGTATSMVTCNPFSNGCKITSDECKLSIGWGMFTN